MNLKMQRLKILKTIHHLEAYRCPRCQTYNKRPTDCCGANRRIIELGKELDRLVAPRKKAQIVDSHSRKKGV